METLSGDTVGRLPEFGDPPGDPLVLLTGWLDLAVKKGVREPFALALATTGEAGRPSMRIVLVKRLDDLGLVFSSYYGSRKGRELTASPYAAGGFYWREVLMQVNLGGEVVRLDERESDNLFASRPRAAQATTIASRQSEFLEDEESLRVTAESLAQGTSTLRRPESWGGYRLVIDEIEFWQGSIDRLHRRLQYTKSDGQWKARRLQP